MPATYNLRNVRNVYFINNALVVEMITCCLQANEFVAMTPSFKQACFPLRETSAFVAGLNGKNLAFLWQGIRRSDLNRGGNVRNECNPPTPPRSIGCESVLLAPAVGDGGRKPAGSTQGEG